MGERFHADAADGGSCDRGAVLGSRRGQNAQGAGSVLLHARIFSTPAARVDAGYRTQKTRLWLCSRHSGSGAPLLRNSRRRREQRDKARNNTGQHDRGLDLRIRSGWRAPQLATSTQSWTQADASRAMNCGIPASRRDRAAYAVIRAQDAERPRSRLLHIGNRQTGQRNERLRTPPAPTTASWNSTRLRLC